MAGGGWWTVGVCQGRLRHGQAVANTRQMMCVIAATLSFAVPHHSLAPASVRHRSPAPRLSDPPSAPLGHVFVPHGRHAVSHNRSNR